MLKAPSRVWQRLLSARTNPRKLSGEMLPGEVLDRHLMSWEPAPVHLKWKMTGLAHACFRPSRTFPGRMLVPNGYPDEMLAAVRERGHDLPSAHREADLGVDVVVPFGRSEERRVGKECRSRWSPY